ncbi:MAG: glycosyltransferase family 4 protein [Bryobacteraceae bacterium]
MTTDAVGGVWRYSVDLAAELACRGVEITMATMGPRPSDTQRDEVFSTPRLHLVESDYALEWMPGAWEDFEAAGRWLLDVQSSFDPDIVHLNGYTHGCLPWNKPVAVVAHSCVYSWWRAVHGAPPDSEWVEYKWRVTRGLVAADAVISPSAHMAGELGREYGMNADNVRVIHNFTRAQASPTRRRQPFILAAGRMWDRAKNVELLDQIAPKLDWQVRIVGSIAGPESSIRNGQHASFVGPLPHPELMEHMSVAGIFAHPALYEPFGLSVLEAARAACCLVLSDIPPMRELWEGAAIFVNPGEPESWICELNRLSRIPEERESLGKLAQSHSMKYRARFSVMQYREVYESLVSSNAGVAA